MTNRPVELTSEDIEQSIASSKKVRDFIEFSMKFQVRSILLIDSFFMIVSSLLGTSTTTPFIESATGISVGAKTGLAR